MFGLMSSEQLSDSFSLNSRRRVFYQYPNGGAPLLGLLSLMETEETDKSEFGWWEDRMDDQKTITATISGADGAFSATGGDVPLTAGGSVVAENDVIRIKTAANGTNKFRARNVVMIKNVLNGSTLTDLKGIVTEIVSTAKMEIRVLTAIADLKNALANSVGLSVIVIGSANPEGARSGTGIFLPPKNITNFTQIFRTAFSFTRTALKAGLLWDKTGIYKSKAKQNCVRHMVELEKAFLFGHKQEYLTTDQGDEVPERTMGGIYYFLEQWETGTPYGVEAPTSDDHPNKRIFKFAGGTTTKKTFLQRLSQIFRVTNNVDYAKLCLCGNGFLGVVQEMFERQLTFQTGQSAKGTYGMNVTVHETQNGTVYYKTHPLLNLLSDFNYSAFFIDVPMLKYRPLSDSDTVLLKNRQDNDADRRKDEWLTEASLELQQPESCGFMDDLRGITLT